jgi:hypothetical protein
MSAMPWSVTVRLLTWERLIAPSPPGVVPVDVEQELGHRPSVRCQQADSLPDTVVGGLPNGRAQVG